MKIGILKADSVLEQFQVDFGEYPEMVSRVLSAVTQVEGDETLEFVAFDVEHGQYPEDIGDCDGYIITGSKKSVYDDEPWIHRLREFVVKLDQTQTPTVGICFGHQMMAEALGGKTEPADVGWRVGVHNAEVLAKAEFMSPVANQFALLYSHKDQVSILPPGATLLASSNNCPNAMFTVGEHMLALQGHPEFIKEYSQGLMELRQEMLGAEKFNAGIASLNRLTDQPLIAAWILRFLTTSRPQACLE